MKEKKLRPELERKIDLYVHGQLNDEQIDDLWAELIQNNYALDYLKTVASLKGVIDEESRQELDQKKSNVRILKSSNWYMAAAAALVLIVGAFGLLQLNTETEFVDPIASIELDYYRSADGTAEGDGGDTVIREAIVLANEGEYQQAIEIIDSGLNQVSDADSRALLFINAGSILYNVSMYEDAIIRFEKVVEIEESDPLVRERAYWYLGNTFFQLNKLEEAKQAFQNAYELNGAYSRVAQSYLKALASR
jgi:tetratricopeptide (TPR) repeat protein